jgi:CxxC motif-containing protein (DUF1111 family)
MKLFKVLVISFFAAFILPLALSNIVIGQGPQEAPAAFDDESNGLVSDIVFDKVKDIYEEREDEDEGVGPVYNATSCAECHDNPVTGGISQVTEFRAANYSSTGVYTDHPGGSLINDRSTDAAIQETVLENNNVRTFRTSLNTLGDGFVEAIDDDTIRAISNNQPSAMRGQVIMVPVDEAGGALRVARFGWKNQHASLVSFSADAYLNEMGITSPLQPFENTSNGLVLNAFDNVPDPEDDGDDVEAFATFMRATKAPPRDAARAATPEAQAGSALFDSIGCATCHVRNITTAPVGTIINGGAFTVPAALGNKMIHPFGDFLLHDVGTGDGIIQNGGPTTRNKLRTPPLWGVRTRNRLMHDGESKTLTDAILRHAGEAQGVTKEFQKLTSAQQNQILAFLRSL